MTSVFYWYTEVQAPSFTFMRACLVYIWLSIYFIGIRKWLVFICVHVCLVYELPYQFSLY